MILPDMSASYMAEHCYPTEKPEEGDLIFMGEEDSDKILEDLKVTTPVNVRNIPTVIVINEKGEELDRFSGTKTESALNDFFNNLNA